MLEPKIEIQVPHPETDLAPPWYESKEELYQEALPPQVLTKSNNLRVKEKLFKMKEISKNTQSNSNVDFMSNKTFGT